MVWPPQSPDQHHGVCLGLQEETEEFEQPTSTDDLWLLSSFKHCVQVYTEELRQSVATPFD